MKELQKFGRKYQENAQNVRVRWIEVDNKITRLKKIHLDTDNRKEIFKLKAQISEIQEDCFVFCGHRIIFSPLDKVYLCKLCNFKKK